MNALQRTAVIVGYEWKRAIAKKKVLALVILAIVFQTIPLIVYSQIPGMSLTEETKASMWVFGTLSGQSLFIQLIAIIVAGGSMSEEYEHGTADILLSKPIRKVEYLSGKFLGGFSLLVMIEAIVVATGVFLGFALFGPQSDLQFAPLIFLAIAYSTLLFFSLTFMFSELFRKSTLTMLTAIGVFIASQVIYSALLMLHNISVYQGKPNEFYLSVSKWLPTWSATNLPPFIASKLIPTLNNPLIGLTTGDIGLAVTIIAIYAIVSIVIAIMRLVRSDVAKKTE